MKRQGLNVTLAQLTDLKMTLIKQQQELQEELKQKDPYVVDYNLKFMVGIINKEGMSDTWELEKWIKQKKLIRN